MSLLAPSLVQANVHKASVGAGVQTNICPFNSNNSQGNASVVFCFCIESGGTDVTTGVTDLLGNPYIKLLDNTLIVGAQYSVWWCPSIFAGANSVIQTVSVGDSSSFCGNFVHEIAGGVTEADIIDHNAGSSASPASNPAFTKYPFEIAISLMAVDNTVSALGAGWTIGAGAVGGGSLTEYQSFATIQRFLQATATQSAGGTNNWACVTASFGIFTHLRALAQRL